MKPSNDKEVTHAYVKFSLTLAAAALIAVFFVFSFLRTVRTEVQRIETRTVEYDRMYAYQTDLVEKVDSLYSYMALLNTSDRINDVVVQGVISNRKMTLLDFLKNVDERDARIYRKLTDQVNTFLSLKDSIRKVSIQEDLVRNDLLRCVQDNKQATRRLTLEMKNEK